MSLDPNRYVSSNWYCAEIYSKFFLNCRKSKEHRSRGSLNDPLLDDANDFKQTDKALSNLGLSDDEKLAIYSAVAAILHLGNIVFEDNAEDARGGCQIAKSSHQALRNASALIGVDPEELHHALLSRVMQPSKGGIKGTVIMVPLKVTSPVGT